MEFMLANVKWQLRPDENDLSKVSWIDRRHKIDRKRQPVTGF